MTARDECTVELEGPEEWWAGTELGLLRVYHFPGHVTASDGSVGPDCGGRVYLDGQFSEALRQRKNTARRGGDELGKSGAGRIRSDPEAHSRHTRPDNSDRREVLCRLVRR